MSSPLVSIVIPTYKPTFLEQAIESALAQTYASIEIMVSDQCPTDDVEKIIKRYPQIHYRRNPVHGVYSNFRNCIRMAHGEYVKFLLDDDLLWPRCVEAMVQEFQEHENTTLVCGWYQLIDESGKEIGLRGLKSDHRVVSTLGGSGPHMLVSTRNPIGPLTSSMFLRKSLPLGLGPWFFTTLAPDQYFGLMDMAIILDLAFQGRVVLLPERLSAMRMHSEQLSSPEKNPRLVYSVKSWLPLVEDAYAFGLLSEKQHLEALKNVLAQFHRFLRMFPTLKEDIAALELKLEALRQR
jgi:glycosyltransferase involved in cell wall biosynthesis